MIKISNFLLKCRIDVRKKIFTSVRNAFGGETEYIISGGASLGTQYVKEFRSLVLKYLMDMGQQSVHLVRQLIEIFIIKMEL